MKYSQLKTLDIIFKLSKQDIENIVFVNETSNIKEKCDIGIILGGVSMIPYRADEGIRLYKEGLIKKILVAGGIGFLNIDKFNKEADKMYKYLIKNGIPKDDIIIEDNSKDTKQNLKYSLKLLSELYNLDNIKLVIITSHFHLKRCINLLKELYDKDFYYFGVCDNKTDINSWKKTLYGKRLIYTEALLLHNPCKTNKILDIDIKSLKLKK